MAAFTNEQWILVALLIAVLLLSIAVMIQHIKLRRILRGKTGRDLEDSFKHIEREYEDMKKFRHDINQYLDSVEKRLKRSVQAITTIRFNPWKGNGEGGNQSFASAFISEKGDGIVLSTLSVRDHMSIFAKPVEKGATPFELTNEENQVLEKALKTVGSDVK